MPFGMNLAPEEFERNLEEKLDDLEGVAVIRDDIIMSFGETQEQAVHNDDENLLKLLERARKVNLRLNSRKMELKKSEVKFMGHIISKDGLKPDPAKVKAVEEMPKPNLDKPKSTWVCQLSFKISASICRCSTASKGLNCKEC